MRSLAFGLAAVIGLNALHQASSPPRTPDPVGMRLDADSAIETASFFAMGMRRLAADLELIRLIIYYGSPEEGVELSDEREDYDPNHPEKHYGGGNYPDFSRKAMRILDMDPAFKYPALLSAGALAFNLNRPQDALDVLEYARRRDPMEKQYLAYIAAVGFARNGVPKDVIRLLEPVLGSPDCPALIKNMMASLYFRTGDRKSAARLFREIKDSREYGNLAREMLAKMGEPL